MKFLLSLAITLLMTVSSFAGPEIRKVRNPVEVKEESVLAKSSIGANEIEGLVWNRWTSKNFVVLAINNEYAKYLNEHLELVKTWCITRWGIMDVDYSSPCKFICVDDPILFEKLFRIKNTKIEIRRDSKGRIKETVIFLLAISTPSHSIPAPVTEVSLAEISERYGTPFSWWTYRGVSILNGPLDEIRQRASDVKKSIDANVPIVFSKSLFDVTKAQYDKFTSEQKYLFDNSATMFCLMIRKEFGQDQFHFMIKDQNFGKIGFKTYDEFDKSFKTYMIDLSKGVVENTTPNFYLQIHEVEKN